MLEAELVCAPTVAVQYLCISSQASPKTEANFFDISPVAATVTPIAIDLSRRDLVPDEAVAKCTGCGTDFSAFVRKHHCRNRGDIFCDKCTHSRTALTADENPPVVRVCERCMAEVSHRLSKAKEAASRPTVVQSHEDLAKKLQEKPEEDLLNQQQSNYVDLFASRADVEDLKKKVDEKMIS